MRRVIATRCLEAIDGIGDRQVRSLGTIGGALASGEPALDIIPVLYCLDATVVIGSSDGTRRVDVDALYRNATKETELRGPRKTILAWHRSRSTPARSSKRSKFQRSTTTAITEKTTETDERCGRMDDQWRGNVSFTLRNSRPDRLSTGRPCCGRSDWRVCPNGRDSTRRNTDNHARNYQICRTAWSGHRADDDARHEPVPVTGCKDARISQHCRSSNSSGR